MLSQWIKKDKRNTCPLFCIHTPLANLALRFITGSYVKGQEGEEVTPKRMPLPWVILSAG